MGQLIMANGRVAFEMVKDPKSGQMVHFMKVLGHMDMLRVMENLSIVMEMYMMECGIEINAMAWVSILKLRLVPFIWVSGKMIINTEKEKKPGKMVQYMWANIRWVKNMVSARWWRKISHIMKVFGKKVI